MNCAEVNEKIEFFVLDELSESEKVTIRVHLAACPACHATEAAYRLLVTRIKQATQPESPRLDFTRAVRSTVKAEIQTIARRSRVRCVISISGSIAACLLLGLAIWQVWIYSVNKAGFVVSKPPSVKLPVEASRPFDSTFRLWRIWLHRGARSIPGSTADGVVVRGQNMYLLQELGSRAYVTALDTRTGRQRWLSDVESCGYLVADDSRVYCLAPSVPEKFDLVALNAADGRTLWRYPQQSPDPLQSPCRPVLLPTGYVCWTTNTTVHMLSSTDGKVLWTHSIPEGGLLSAAVVVDNDLYVANSIRLYCLNIETGEQSWNLEYGDGISGQCRPLLTTAEGDIYASLSLGFGSRLFCMKLKTPKILWHKVVAHVTHLYTAGDKLYLRNQNVQALDRATGELLWTYSATGCNPVTYTEELAYFVDSSGQGRLIALDRYTGNKVWELPGLRSCNAFVKVDSTGFVKTHDGVVHAIILKG